MSNEARTLLRFEDVDDNKWLIYEDQILGAQDYRDEGYYIFLTDGNRLDVSREVGNKILNIEETKSDE